MKKLVVFSVLFIVLSACLKEELPVPKKDWGDATLAEVNIGGNYEYQAYFDFTTGEVVKKHSRDKWELGFQCGIAGEHIIINGSKQMFVYPTDKDELADITSKSGYLSNQRFDSPYGETDSLAMHNWQDGKVRIIDMGYNSSNVQQGWYKIKVHEVTNSSYTFEFAPLEETTSTITTIEKNDDYNFVFYSMLTKEEVDVEPKKDEWDLVFTQFTQRLYEPLVMPYLVTGALLNRKDVRAKKLTQIAYDDIDLEYALSLSLSDTLNIIGYDWKEFDFDTEIYTIYDDVSYVLKNRDGYYYKLRFLDFYNATGETGNCQFEYQFLGN